jgi:hypothetical protein
MFGDVDTSYRTNERPFHPLVFLALSALSPLIAALIIGAFTWLI